ncbi:hypothetical protein EMCRGX_G032667 [Ephydatia muelleri]
MEDRLALLENVFDRIDEIDKTVNELKTTMRDVHTILQDAFHENSDELAEVLPSCVWSDVSTTLKSKLLESVRGHLRHNKYTVPPEKKIMKRVIKDYYSNRRSTVLMKADSSKVYTRLQKLGVCMSHESVVALHKICGQNFDADVLIWRDLLVEDMLQKQQQSSCQSHNTCTYSNESDTESNESSDSDEDSDENGTDTECDIEDDCRSEEECESTCSCSEEDIMEKLKDNHSKSIDIECEDDDDEITGSQNDVSCNERTCMHDKDSSDSLTESCSGSSEATIGITHEQQDQLLDDSEVTQMVPKDLTTWDTAFVVTTLIKLCAVVQSRVCIPRDEMHFTSMPDKTEIAATLLPSLNDDQILKENVAILVSRILTNNLKFFRLTFQELIQWHIKHPYYKEMSSKSLVVPLGILLKNENKASDMIGIVNHIHHYVPAVPDIQEQVLSTGETVDVDQTSLHTILFGGDQLTCARARSAIDNKLNSQTPHKRFMGIEPVIEEWHTKVNFLRVIWKYYYNPKSSAEHVIESHIVALAMNILGMTNADQAPDSSILPDAHLLWMQPDDFRTNVLKMLTLRIVDELSLNFNNFVYKDTDDKSISGLGANKSASAMQRVAQALGAISPFLRNFDEECKISQLKGVHNRQKAEQDMKILLTELAPIVSLGHSRRHKTFTNPRDPLHMLSYSELNAWIEKHIT